MLVRLLLMYSSGTVDPPKSWFNSRPRFDALHAAIEEDLPQLREEAQPITGSNFVHAVPSTQLQRQQLLACNDRNHPSSFVAATNERYRGRCGAVMSIRPYRLRQVQFMICIAEDRRRSILLFLRPRLPKADQAMARQLHSRKNQCLR